MESLDFSLKVISPAFVAGAMEQAGIHQEGEKEQRITHRIVSHNGDGLRIPSLRGILRFWFRAMNGHLTLKELKKGEREVFGDTNCGQGFRLIPAGTNDWRYGEIKGQHRDGFGYLGYGPIYPKRKEGVTSHHRHGYRDAVLPGAIFHFRAIGDDYQLAALQKCLLLLHLFGGIGSRSRRGWGSVAVETAADFLPSWKAEQPIDDWFRSALLSLWPSDSNPLKTQSNTAYSAFSQNTLICISAKTWGHGPAGYKDVLKVFYERMKAIRDCKNGTFGPVDHHNEYKDYGNNSFSHIPKRIAFGLPYQAISRTSAMGMRYKGMLPTGFGEKEIERRASPLLLKIFLAPNNRLHAVSLFLKAQFFGNKKSEIGAEKRIPGDYGKEDSWNLLNQRLAFSDWSAVEAFLKNEDWQQIFRRKPRIGDKSLA